MKDEAKLCKYCKTEIPSGAKVCPNCRKKQGGKMKWIIIIIVAIIVVAAIANGGKGDDKPVKVGEQNSVSDDNNQADENEQDSVSDSDSQTQENEQGSVSDDDNQAQDEETIFKVGEIAELNGVQVALTDYRESTGGDFNKPDDGNIFVLAEFEIVNNTDDELAVSSLLSFEAYDADDYKLDYSLSALMEKEGSQLDGTIAPGKKLKGWIGWEVPSDYKNIEVHFTDNVWTNNKFKFMIEK